MSMPSHTVRDYHPADRRQCAAQWPAVCAERWQHDPGLKGAHTAYFTDVAIALSGQCVVKRTGDGQKQEGLLRAGTIWLCPEGTYESGVEVIGGTVESLHLMLPPGLVGQNALANYGIDPAKVRLAFAGGFTDPLILQVGSAFATLLRRRPQPTDRLLVDGLHATLAARLLANYTADTWREPAHAPAFERKRLKRVLDFIEARLGADISLEDLAAEACLSPFHFSRLFREATGRSPHRYLTERRIEAAKEKLRLGHSSLVEIALDAGFGTQANFNRVFKRMTGQTPGQYRTFGGC